MGKLDKELDNLTAKLENMVGDFVDFAKRHKKLLLTFVGLYLVTKYFFGENEDE